jgi:hypothetical protein
VACAIFSIAVLYGWVGILSPFYKWVYIRAWVQGIWGLNYLLINLTFGLKIGPNP